MKKKVLLVSLPFIVLMLVMSMVGCTPPDVAAPPEDTTEGTVKDESPVLELTMQTHLTGLQHERVAKTVVETIAHTSGGTIKITAYPAGTLVPAPEMLESLRTGTLDMVLVGEGYFAGLVPVSELATGIPYAYRNQFEPWLFMWHRGFVDILREQYAKQGAYVIPFEYYSVGLMTKKPINSLDDLRGMKLRAFGTMGYWLTEAGSSVSMIPGAELYTALATGVVDGTHWADAGPMYEMRFYEVLDYYMLPEPAYGAWNSVLVGMDLWNQLTNEQKRAIEMGTIAGGRVSRDMTRILSGRALYSMVRNYGVQTTILSEEEQEKAREIAIRSWDKIAEKDPANAEVISMLKDFMEEQVDDEKVSPPFEMPW